MSQTYYEQSDRLPRTLSVAELIAKLSSLPRDLPVVFKSPETGAYGPNHKYSIDRVEIHSVDRREETIPGGTRIDDETGEPESYEPFTMVWHAWAGVVIG